VVGPAGVSALHAYDETTAPGTHIGLPGTSVTWVLPVGEPLVVTRPDRDVVAPPSWSQISGLHLHAVGVQHGARQAGVYVELTIAGARSLLGLPASQLAEQLVDLEDLDGAGSRVAELRRLPEQLASAPRPDWARLVLAALAAARRRVDDERRPGLERPVAHALSRLGRGAHVTDVADEVGYSRRHLGDLVRAETGVSPTHWRRLARFERSRDPVVDALRHGGTLAGAASEAGYADHAHLTREWVSLAGLPPTAWGRAELPSVQDAAPGEEPG